MACPHTIGANHLRRAAPHRHQHKGKPWFPLACPNPVQTIDSVWHVPDGPR